MEYEFPGGLLGFLFLWGLWEWSKSKKKEKRGNLDKNDVVTEVEKKPDKVVRIVYVIIGMAILALIIVFIILFN